jgi:hypothetical protein
MQNLFRLSEEQCKPTSAVILVLEFIGEKKNHNKNHVIKYH